MRRITASIPYHQAVSQARDLLRRLATNDERSVRSVLAVAPELVDPDAPPRPALDRNIKSLVRLAALLALDASSESIRWAVDLAATSGADDDALLAVLIAAAPAAGSAQLVASAPQLALALGFDPPPGSSSY